MGGSAQDARFSSGVKDDWGSEKEPPQPSEADLQQPCETALGWAVSRASCSMVKRFLDEGANAHIKQWHTYHPHFQSTLKNGSQLSWDVTGLYIARACWDVAAIQALDRDDGHYLLCSPDSRGRLPIHCAAMGPGDYECLLPETDGTTRLLCLPAPSSCQSEHHQYPRR